MGWLAKLGPSAIGGLLLVAATIVAMVWANSSFAGSYVRLFEETKFTIGIEEFHLSKPLILWVNDALMAVFFLLVGLEIKREMQEGELSTPRRAALPMVAAAGGVAFPALIYTAFNLGSEHTSGWAIPAATDIAFALGILALLGSRVPLSIKVFLTAVAVVDDLVAVLIIALFYTETIKLAALGIAGGALVLLIAGNRLNFKHPVFYVLFGVVLWVAVLKSGVHATVAGVLLAFTIPSRRGVEPKRFSKAVGEALKVKDHEDPDDLAPETRIHSVRALCNQAEPMLVRWEHALQPWVMFLIMPIFALANAGVVLGGGSGDAMSVSTGVGFGLLFGKPIGITLFAWLTVKLGWAALPGGTNWKQLHGAAWLGGIGFTMSLFIADLALEGTALTAAKMGLLAGSIVAGIIGTIILLKTTSKPTPAAVAAD
ncbi:MAG: Na+/H+ antiporter NhaA [Myxococcales bacterium]|nr:Na+/H+ antiporter NhaA [Myxococcales bacterium]